MTGRAEDQNQYEDAFQDCRILMAEDNDINAMIAVELLEGMGAKVDVAQNGQLALEAFQAKPKILLRLYPHGRADARPGRPALPVPSGPWTGRTPQRSLIFALSADAFIRG